MTTQEHKELLNKIREAGGDIGKVTDLLTELSEDYSTVIGENLTLKTDFDKIKVDNDELVKCNSKLFMKVGVEGVGQKQEVTKEDENKLPSVEDCFDENGRLK